MSGKYEDLEVWRVGMELVFAVYEQTSHFPKDELYGLTSQMRRAAVSIPSNVAEGKGRTTDRDFAFLCHARGSVYELQTQIQIACHLRYLTEGDASLLKSKADRVGQMLNRLIAAVSKARAASSNSLQTLARS